MSDADPTPDPDTAAPPAAGAAGRERGDAPAIDLSEPRSVHVVGVGGAGMSAIATVLAAMGHRVSGSDLRASPGVDRLRAAGVAVAVGHDAAHVPGGLDALTRSTAVGDDNPEVQAARAAGVDVLSRADVLAAICAARRTIAVAGTHGKTTTSSMLALALRAAGLAPSFIIGGDVNELGTGAVWDRGDWFVVEADESDGTFLELPRAAAIVTNVEPDHLEHYGGWPQLQAAFEQFAGDTPGPVLCCADDDGAVALAASTPGSLTYGEHDASDYRMAGLDRHRGGVGFDLVRGGAVLARVELPVPGLHNARNAAGALALAVEIGADPLAAAGALSRFGGVARRFEPRGEVRGVTLVDDYAHLPTEVAAALTAARDGDWRRVVAVFQPHRYSRTASLWQDFADAFVDADLLVVTDVYAAGEEPRPGISGKLVVDAVLDAHPRTRVAWLPHRADLLAFLPRELQAGDLCLTLGAGDLTTLPDELAARLATSPGS